MTYCLWFWYIPSIVIFGQLAQLVRASGLHPECREFDPLTAQKPSVFSEGFFYVRFFELSNLMHHGITVFQIEKKLPQRIKSFGAVFCFLFYELLYSASRLFFFRRRTLPEVSETITYSLVIVIGVLGLMFTLDFSKSVRSALYFPTAQPFALFITQ